MITVASQSVRQYSTSINQWSGSVPLCASNKLKTHVPMQRDLTYFVAIHIGFLLVLQTRLLTLNVNFEAKHKSGHIMNKMENSKNHVLQVI